MRITSSALRAAAWAAAGLLLASGCTPARTDNKVTALHASVTVTAPDQVARVVVTAVSSGATYSIDLVKVSPIQWSGVFRDVAAATDYWVTAEGYDAAGTLLYQGASGYYAVYPGQTTFVGMFAQQVSPPATYGNTPPKIDAVYASSLVADPGATIQVSVNARDPDPDAVLTYSWSATDGTFDTPSAAGASWTAPPYDTIAYLTIDVTDDKGTTAQATFAIQVGQPKGDLQADVWFRTTPDIFLVSASPTRVDVGQPAYLWVNAVDADGDPLYYYWYSDCGGWFDNPYGPATYFYPDYRPPGDLCHIYVSVNDYTGSGNVGWTGLWIGPPVVPTPPPGDEYTYSADFWNGEASVAQCEQWVGYAAGLATGYTSMTVSGTFDQTGITCTDPAVVNAMAQALKGLISYTATCDGHTWSNCSRYGDELWIDPPGECSGSNCPVGYIVRPCIVQENPGNANWGGVNTATCYAPSQTMKVTFR